MNRSLNASLLTVQVLEPNQESGLRVFGLRWESESRLRYNTLDEAMKAESLEVTEVNESGSVPALLVTNKSDAPAFLMAGEQLIGAKQNRILNVSMMLPASTTLTVPVSCVEAGRWNRRSHKFSSGGSMSHGMLKKMLSNQTHAGLSQRGQVRSPIREPSGTRWRASSRRWVRHRPRPPSIRCTPTTGLGWTTSSRGCIPPKVVMEWCSSWPARSRAPICFDQPGTLSKLWTKLVRAYALDALETREAEAPPVTTEDISRWIHAAAGAKPSPTRHPDSDATSGSKRRDSSARPSSSTSRPFTSSCSPRIPRRESEEVSNTRWRKSPAAPSRRASHQDSTPRNRPPSTRKHAPVTKFVPSSR